MSWGFHAILDIYKACGKSIRCAKNIEAFSNTLVKRIDMKAYGSPQIIHFGSGNKAGYTLVQLIETSNISAHFTEEDDCIYLDVFSCKPFDANRVKEVVDEFFKPESVDCRFLTRQAKPGPRAGSCTVATAELESRNGLRNANLEHLC